MEEHLRWQARNFRRRAGLTQAEVARRIGTSQPWVARMERGQLSPTLTSFTNYLAAVGAKVEILASYEPLSPAAAAAWTLDREVTDETFLRVCMQVVNDFTEASDPIRREMVEAEPSLTTDRRWDAFLAGLAEHLALSAGLKAPAWTNGPSRFLPRWWLPISLPSVRTAALVESPAAFRRRGIFITADFFSHV